MSWTLHELLGNKYPVYFCQFCQQSFEHPPDEHPAACSACNSPLWLPALTGALVCEHEGHRLIPKRLPNA
jgi:DNA-directed RNA polymerase subunit RPC12/RpoP